MDDKLQSKMPVLPLQVALIGACSLAMTCQTAVLLETDGLTPALMVLVYAGTLFGYHWNSLHTGARVAAWCGGLAAGAAWLLLDPSTRLATLGPAVCWILYFGLQHPQAAGLRYSAWLKPLSISVTWALVTVWLPLSPGSRAHAWPLLFERGLFIFALALAYDLHDRSEDRWAGLDTLALRLGATGTFRLMNAAFFLSACAVCLSATNGLYAWPVAGLLTAHLVFARFFLRALLHNRRFLRWQKVLIDALMLLQAGLVFLVEH